MKTTDGLIEQYPDTRERPRRFTPRFVPLSVRVIAQHDFSEGVADNDALRREALFKRSLGVADMATAALLVLAVLPLLSGEVRPLLLLGALPSVLLLCKVFGLYDRDPLVLNKTTLDEAPTLFQVAGISVLLLWLALDGWTSVELDASQVMLIWAAAFIGFFANRLIARQIALAVATTERCMVVADRATIAALREKIDGGRGKSKVVATLNLETQHLIGRLELGQEFREAIRRCNVHRVVVAPGASSGETLELVRIAKHAGVKVSVLPAILEVVGSSVEFDHVGGLTMLGIRRFGLTRSSRRLKRVFDLIGATLLMVIFAPAMALIALAIKCDSRGPVLFRQTRVGKDSRRFPMLKFRSMYADADVRKDALRHLNEADGLFKIKEDPRVTSVGRLLRRTSLDELPQIFNVWRGEMSLVGPRPLVVDEDERVTGFHRHRLHLTPGMTGPWQVLGSARIPMQEMVGIDYLYVANWSLWTDIKILLRTVIHVATGRGM